MKNIILIIGSLVTIVLSILWYKNIVSEPIAAISSAVLTFLGYLFSNNDNNNNKPNKIKQTHYGSGDNVAGNKIIKG